MLRILAFAKINTYLCVVDKLPDGYHSLETVMQTVSLADELQITPNNDGVINFSCDNSELEKSDNLILKACDLFFETTGFTGGFDIHLIKRIPVAAGLGGGSSDAAATLTALNHIYNSPLKTTELERISLKLGADVPFFIRGGCSLAEGKGEVLTPIKKQSSFYYVLIKHGNKSSTKDMYTALDTMQFEKKNETPDFMKLANDYEYLCKMGYNDFLKVSTIDAKLQSDILAASTTRFFLSGSGPSCYCVFDNLSSATAVYNELKPKYEQCFLVEDTDAGSRIV